MTRLRRRPQGNLLPLGLSVIAAALPLVGCNHRGGTGTTAGDSGGSASRSKIEPTMAPVLNNNGVMLLEHWTGDAPGALAVFQKAVDTDPNYAIGWVNLGIGYFAQQQPEYNRIVDALNRAEKLGSTVPNLYFTRGLAKYNLVDYPGAQADFERVAKADPSDAFTRYHLGMALKGQNKYQEAADNFRMAIGKLGNFQSAWMNLGQCCQRINQPQEAARALEKTRTLQDSKTGITASRTGYFAGLGRYVEPVPDPHAPRRAAGGPIPAFTDASSTTLAGLAPYTWKGGLAPAFSASWGDYDNDGKPDLLLGRANVITLLHNDGGTLKSVAPIGLAYPGGTINGASWGDFDNDGKEDVLIFGSAGARVFRNLGEGKFVETSRGASAGAFQFVDGHSKGAPLIAGDIAHATWVDFDHDGFLDLLAVRSPAARPPGSSPVALYRNDGGKGFKDVTVKAGFSAIKGATYALPADFDHNRAVDFAFVDAEGAPSLLRNNYDGTFSPVLNAAGLSALGKCRQIATADLNSDGLLDFVAATDRGVQVAIHQPDDTFKLQPIVGSTNPQIVQSVGIADLDNDGNLDVVALNMDMTGMGGESYVAVYQGNGDGTFRDVTAQAGLDRIKTRSSSRLALADVDGNGAVDIIVPGAAPLLLRNAGNTNRWVRLNLRGLKVSPNPKWRDGARTNGSGLGVLAEAWTDATWAAMEVSAASGDDHQPIFGLGSTGSPRWVRVLWTSGVHECEPIGDQKGAGPAGIDYRQLTGQNDRGEQTAATHMYLEDNGKETFLGSFGRAPSMTDLPGPLNATWSLWEPNRDPTSCPVLYTWDGKRYRFITDLQGGAIIGYNVGEYQYAPNDPDEYVMLPEGALALKDGKYDVEIADQLQEILYIDAVHLLAVDHPARTQVFSNDRMKAAPPFAVFDPWSVDEVRPPKSVVGNRGEDVSGLVSTIDRQYPDDFQRLPFEGFSERHTLTIDLGDRGDLRDAGDIGQSKIQNPKSKIKQVYLLLYGWQKYAHSSSNLAAAHAGIYGESPSVQVRDAKGAWKTVIQDMGAVAGLPKWLAVDLTGKFLSKDRRVRIVTNLELFWDKIEVGLLHGDGPTRVTRLTPEAADYHWLGYPQPLFPDGKEPVVYDFDRRRDSAPWWTPAGYYTRTGDITELLQKPDDKYVIMRHGHAMHIRFDPATLPPLPAGWKRDFVLMSDGFGKDMDMNGATALTVDPLPFHKMTRYPYGKNEHYPNDPDHVAYRAKYNTWYQSGVGRVAQWPELHLGESGAK